MKYKRILLVDDDKITNFLNENLIKEMDICENISIAQDGQEALDFLKSQHNAADFTDLIFLDLNMPVMDGFEFLEKLKELSLPNPVSIILLTTSSNQRDVDRSKQFSITAYINKPLTEAKIHETLGILK